MKKQPVPYKKIVFVCTNHRDETDRPCCANGGSVELHAKLKEMVKERGLGKQIRVSKSGCLDRCGLGPNIMVFPDNTWYSGVTETDLESIVAEITVDIER
jgi:(2Fe-2S) ferredoxin